MNAVLHILTALALVATQAFVVWVAVHHQEFVERAPSQGW